MIHSIKKFFRAAAVIIFLSGIVSCYDNPADNPAGNKPPETHLFIETDSTISQQQSSLKLYWWGDDPDGLVTGYYLTWDDVHWFFTVKNDSLISFPIQGSDTVYNLKVAAVDNNGNGVFDNEIIRNGINLGREPFSDQNNNGVYDAGELFIDIGDMDPEPAELMLPLKNSAPVIKFLTDKNNSVIQIPDTTFTVASFGWTASDIDGDATISNFYISLNDSLNAVEIPGNTRFITIKAEPPFTSDVVEASVFLGTSVNTAYHEKLPGLRLNSKNKIIIYAKDIAGAFSEKISMPSTDELTWYVKKPAGEILVIDDNAVADNAASFYAAVFDSLGLSSKVDIWNIDAGKTATSSGKLLPKFISPQFTETLKLFKYIFWYTDNIPTLEPAQISISNYVNSGGKVLFSMIFPQVFDSRGLSDFLPVDSLSPAPISIIPRNTKIIPTAEALNSGYPDLSIDDNLNPVARIRTYYPKVSAVTLYNLEYSGNPVIGFKGDSRLIFMGIPLHRANGAPHKVTDFFREVFIDEFGVSR